MSQPEQEEVFRFGADSYCIVFCRENSDVVAQVIVQIDASGSGTAAPDKQLERTISVSLKKLHGVLV